METLLGLALKSLLIAGVTLALLHFTRARSSAERSWIAHLGLFALVALPLASLALPALHIDMPAALTPAAEVAAPTPAVPSVIAPSTEAPVAAANVATTEPATQIASIDWAPYAYAAPAIALLLITLLALLRLFALRSRAQVLVDPIWLSALAHAQRRMGFKNGTALLTSNELSSPISWGLMRPVILLNDEALEATGEAEAIIAHELAHVARLDWAKLMLARVATAIFWFNPLAWVLAREAHQLREEAADDAVLGANIADTDYAQLLVGVARHECKGLLLGAHGISPGKDSLRRRVRRVLDGTLARGPAQRSWVAGFAAGMLVMAAPLAALTFAPSAKDKLSDKAVADAETGATLVVRSPQHAESIIRNADGTRIDNLTDGTTVLRNPNGATITVYAPDANGRRKLVMRSAKGAIMTYADARDVPGMGGYPFNLTHGPQGARDSKSEIDRAIDMKALGVTPEYLAEIRRAAPQLGQLDADEAIEMRAIGVTPDYIRDLAAAGFGNLDQDKLVEARAIGVTGNYVRSMKAAGVRGSLDDYVEMRALGIDVHDVTRARAMGKDALTAEKLVDIKTGNWEPPNINVDVDVDPDPDPNQ